MTKSEAITYKFLRYEEDLAICDDNNGGEKSFLKEEVFDVNKLMNVANHLLNLGFWEEGMESMILHL